MPVRMQLRHESTFSERENTMGIARLGKYRIEYDITQDFTTSYCDSPSIAKALLLEVYSWTALDCSGLLWRIALLGYDTTPQHCTYFF